MSEDISKAALALYTPPFRYECGYIFDANSNMVADDATCDAFTARVRGWGRIQYMDKADELQDAVWEHLAAAMTEYWERHAPAP